MRLIDTHAHLQGPEFNRDLEPVLARAVKAGVQLIINVGYDLNSSKRAIQLYRKYPMLPPAVGIHPHDAKTWSDEVESSLRRWAGSPHVVAIGEIGLDFYKDYSPRAQQLQVLEKQLQIALDYRLPVILHVRNAYMDILNVLKNFPSLRGVMHAFSGSPAIADKFISMGWHIGVGGVITFSNARKLQEVVQRIPLEYIVLETDAPFLTPHPYRGKRNEPSYLKFICQQLAAILQRTPDEVAEITYLNAKRLFPRLRS